MGPQSGFDLHFLMGKDRKEFLKCSFVFVFYLFVLGVVFVFEDCSVPWFSFVDLFVFLRFFFNSLYTLDINLWNV